MKLKKIRDFAFIWAGIFAVIGVYPLFKSSDIRLWSIVIAFLFLIVGLSKPVLLNNFYKIWTKFGEFMGGIISKIILFILYFGLFTPISLFLKLLGKDLLDKKIDKSKHSYWTNRETQPESMKKQF